MRFLKKLERKIGKYAIPDLSLYLIMGYIIGYVLILINDKVHVMDFLTLNPYLILHGQVWRLITWIIIPPTGLSIWTIIMLFFYYSVGTSLERTWGTFLYNVYIFSGIILTIIGSFVLMGISYLPIFELSKLRIAYGDMNYFMLLAQNFTSYYVNMSILLAFAATFPEAMVYLMGIIPLKMKWLGVAYGVMLIVEFLQNGIVGKIVIGTSLLNFVIFFLMTRRGLGMRVSPKQVKRRHDYNKEIKKARPVSVAKHKCAVCGRNSEDNPEAEFRFCSKCNGNYEYCQEHLFTHTHVK